MTWRVPYGTLGTDNEGHGSMALSISTIEALRELQQVAWQNSEDKGFHSDRPNRDDFVPGERGDRAYAIALRDNQSNKLMLIVGEASEGHEELRSGKPADLTYYPTAIEDSDLLVHPYGPGGLPAKPEGLPSELADIVIRAFDTAEIEKIDLAGMIAEKIIYNASRPYKHGKSF